MLFESRGRGGGIEGVPETRPCYCPLSYFICFSTLGLCLQAVSTTAFKKRTRLCVMLKKDYYDEPLIYCRVEDWP